ncbi:MAG: sugar porter family MFS transporter [Candidatus Obscuribacter sp.]|nr:sugar porter family MFS transporter [Candidatus Obscuribacter sp.]
MTAGKFNGYLLRCSLVGALGGLLFGFDTAVISGATHSLTQTFTLTPFWLGMTVASALWGTVISALTAGVIGERLGARETLRITALAYVLSAIGCAFAWDLPSLIFFRFLGGLGIGGSSVLGPLYIAELAPAKWRGRLVGLFQINIVVGILLAYFSNYLIGLAIQGSTEWRWQLGVSGIPALLFLIMLFGIPRSPRWLVAKGLEQEAREVLNKTSIGDAEAELQEIIVSIDEAKAAQAAKLFTPRYKFPIFLAIATGAFNQLTGINAILYYLNDIFALAGYSKVSSGFQAVIIGATNLLFTLIAMAVIDKLGRKQLLLIGSVGMSICLAGVAVIMQMHKNMESLVWFLVAYIGFFAFSQGAVIWVYISEIFPTQVRAKGQSLGCSTHWIMNALISGTFPMLAAQSGSMPFYFFALMMVAQFLVVLFIFPETKGITLEQMEKRLGMAQNEHAHTPST